MKTFETELTQKHLKRIYMITFEMKSILGFKVRILKSAEW